jgi:hypothetical protein
MSQKGNEREEKDVIMGYIYDPVFTRIITAPNLEFTDF